MSFSVKKNHNRNKIYKENLILAQKLQLYKIHTFTTSSEFYVETIQFGVKKFGFKKNPQNSKFYDETENMRKRPGLRTKGCDLETSVILEFFFLFF